MSAVGAERRALHGAEHRSSMDRVMAGASAVFRLSSSSARGRGHGVRPESVLNPRHHSPLHRIQYELRLIVRFSRKNRTRSSGQSGSDRRADVSLIRRRSPHRLRTRGQSTRDTDSHGVSDPPDRRGAIASARARVAHAMVSCSDRSTGARTGRQRAPPTRRAVRRALCGNRARRIDYGHRLREQEGVAEDLSATVVSATQGDDLNFRGRPPGRPLLWVSGDVNQGREMQVLA